MTKVIQVKDDSTKFCWHWTVKNSTLTLQLSFCQLVVAVASLAQHVYSLKYHDHIFFCHFRNQSKAHGNFLSFDIIIFDFGLFHEILGVQECIANYLDGGYLRCSWCVGQILAIVVVLTVPLLRVAHSWLLWPMLTMQNIYCIGMTILTIATIGKLIMAVVNHLSGRLIWLAVIYLFGAASNWFLNYILWHFYWYLESAEKVRRANRNNNTVFV